MAERPVCVEYPHHDDAGPTMAIQDLWLGARFGSEDFLLCPESLTRLREMIASRNILVARRNQEIVTSHHFLPPEPAEHQHPNHTANLDYKTEDFRLA